MTTQATLEMQAGASGAGYSIYWKQDANLATVGDTHVTGDYRRQLQASGKKLSFAEASKATVFDLLGPSPVAQAMRTRKPVFVQDISREADDERAAIAIEYGIRQVAFVPVLGGVIEFGATVQNPWLNVYEALQQTMPNEEIETALASGATYMMFWQRNERKRSYQLRASFEISKNQLSQGTRDSGESYITKSAEIQPAIGGVGPIAVCGQSASVIKIGNTATSPNFMRRELAQEWGVGKATFVPLETGVLEFGTVTKDKRDGARASGRKQRPASPPPLLRRPASLPPIAAATCLPLPLACLPSSCLCFPISPVPLGPGPASAA